jgi:hydroxymethylglutaryl-CoA reductase
MVATTGKFVAYEPDRSVKAAASPGREAERRERLHGLELRARLDRVAAWTGVPPTDVEALSAPSPLSFEAADRMVENAIGVLGVPLGVALNVRVNGRDRVVPMAVEEPSVIAAASLGADLVREASRRRPTRHT